MLQKTVLQPGDVIDGRFELVVVRGASGMGRVFEAREASTGRKVALKTLLASGGSTERFEREGAALARFSHPNIVTYVASGRESDGSPWLAMEWLDAEDLATRLARGALSVEETLTLARGVASALDAAHARALIRSGRPPRAPALPRPPRAITRAKLLGPTRRAGPHGGSLGLRPFSPFAPTDVGMLRAMVSSDVGFGHEACRNRSHTRTRQRSWRDARSS